MYKGTYPNKIRYVSFLEWEKFKNLLSATYKGDIDLVSELMNDPKVRIFINETDTNGETALMAACKKGNKDIVKLLLEKGADVNIRKYKNNRTALMFACRSGNIDIINELLIKGAGKTINDENLDGKTVLMEECELEDSRVDIVEALLLGGADIGINYEKLPEGITALEYACLRSRTDIVDILLKNGARADAEKRREDNIFSLIIACNNGNLYIVKMLLERGGAVNIINVKDSFQKTALMYACHKVILIL
jgi:ankyrin repeat protein